MNARAAALAAWLLVAFVLGATGALRDLRPPLPQAVIAGLVAALLLAGFAPASGRRWLRSIPLSWLVGLHLTRFVGFYFLALYGEGRLPDEGDGLAPLAPAATPAPHA